MSKFNPRLTILAFVAASLGSGCATQMIKDVEHQVISDANEIERLIPHARSGARPEVGQNRRARIYNQAWIPVREVSEPESQPGYEQGRRRIQVNRGFEDVADVAKYLTVETGIPVAVSTDVIEFEREDELERQQVQSTSGGRFDDDFDLPALPLGNFFKTNITYDGALSGFLDSAASRFNVSWRWEEDGTRIRFFKYDTRTFRIAALPGNTSLTSRVALTNNGQEGNASNQDTAIEFGELSVWTSVEQAVEAMISRRGRYSVSPATGTVTVTDTPNVIEKIATYVNEQNESLSKQVVINVRVLSVDISKDDSYGINWDAVYRSLSETYGLSFSTAFVPAEGAAQLSARILDTATGRTGAWSGSNAVVSALSTQGRVSQVTSGAVTAMNNQAVPLQVGRQIAYIRSSQTTLSGDNSTTAIEPGTVNTGFSMNLIPHIMDNDTLLLQYGADLSTLLGIESVSSGDATIQTPEIETRNFLQRVRLNSGDMLVVAGFEQSNQDMRTQGVGRAANMLLGGGASGRSNRNAIVVLIQPVIVDL